MKNWTTLVGRVVSPVTLSRLAWVSFHFDFSPIFFWLAFLFIFFFSCFFRSARDMKNKIEKHKK